MEVTCAELQLHSSPYALWPSIATFKVEKGSLPDPPRGPLAKTVPSTSEFKLLGSL